MNDVDTLKYNLNRTVSSTGSLGIAYIRDEAQIRFTVVNADVGNTLRVEARLVGQASWVTLLDLVGSDSEAVDVSTYEEVQVSVFAYDSLTDHIFVYASSFDNAAGGSSFSGDYNDLINTPTIPVINDSITNGNTTSGPSENAVFDALALKADQSALDAHINDTVDAHDASAISSVPSGNLAATEVQAALNELQSDIDTRGFAITAKDEGSTLTSSMSSIDFVGAGVTATNTGGAVTVTVGAGGGPTFLTGSAMIDFANIVTDNMLDFAITVTGANPGDFVVLGRPIDQDPGLVTEAFVSATAVVIVRAHNVQSVAVDQPAKLYRVLVIQ